MSQRIEIMWRARTVPLMPRAVAARGAAAIALAQRLLTFDDEALAKLEGVAGDGLLIALGEAAALPWVDGVVYLGRDPAAPSLLLPTTMETEVPLALFERALTQQEKDASPIAVLIAPPVVASVNPARPIARQTLIDWLNQNKREVTSNREGMKG